MKYIHGGCVIKENPKYPKTAKWKHGCVIITEDEIEVIEYE